MSSASRAFRCRCRPGSNASGSSATRRAGGPAPREGFAIVDPADDSVVGLALAARIDRETQTVELGYVVSPTARGRGVATEALRLLSDWAFRELDALRLELLISEENVASQRVAERCGYVQEGLLRSVYTKPGVREDTQIWSRLPTDP